MIALGMALCGCSQKHNVLCLGNSITRHMPKDDIGWYSDWGMAASSADKDYCHLLETMLQQRNAKSTVTPLNIAFWERNLDCNIDSLIAKNLQGKDIVVIRLGENVKDKSLFRSRILDLVQRCKQQTPNVIITGCFWEDAEKEDALINAAKVNGLSFVPLEWILRDHSDIACPSESDVIQDMNGGTYTLFNEDVMAHPGDEGMRMIAESIFSQIR